MPEHNNGAPTNRNRKEKIGKEKQRERKGVKDKGVEGGVVTKKKSMK